MRFRSPYGLYDNASHQGGTSAGTFAKLLAHFIGGFLPTLALLQ
jgi:hypothetical protein